MQNIKWMFNEKIKKTKWRDDVFLPVNTLAVYVVYFYLKDKYAVDDTEAQHWHKIKLYFRKKAFMSYMPIKQNGTWHNPISAFLGVITYLDSKWSFETYLFFM